MAVVPYAPAHGTRSVRGLPNRRVWAVLLAIVFLGAAAIGQLGMLNRGTIPASASDLAQVWVGVRTVLQGRNPYSAETTRKIQRIYYGQELDRSDPRLSQRFAYPVSIAVVLSPLALLPWPLAQLLYRLLSTLLMAASVPMWLSLLGLRADRWKIGLLTLLVLVSWPVVWGIRLGQVTLLVAALLAVACWLLRAGQQVGQQVAAGIFLALATIKPQISLILTLWLLLWALRTRRPAFIASFALTLGLLLGVAEYLLPRWFASWHAALRDYSQYTQMKPALLGIFGNGGGTVAVVLLTAASCRLLWRWRAVMPSAPYFGSACALSLALTASLLPPLSGMIYNQVLLIPGSLLVLHRPNFGRYMLGALLGLTFLSVPVALGGEYLFGPAPGWFALPFMNLILPACVVLAICFPPRQRLSISPDPS